MSTNWESVFEKWGQPPSQTEQDKAQHSVGQIRDAIRSNDKLNSKDIHIFLQGSNRNRVNVRGESDVDVGVLCKEVFFHDFYPSVTSNKKALIHASFNSSNYYYTEFKNDVELALVNKFGRNAVKRGNKSFDIKENSYRLDADVAAFFEHKRYGDINLYDTGVKMAPDNFTPREVINWPDQHYDNGVAKNEQTQKRYKGVVRILKTLSNKMAEEGNAYADNIPGFLIECLVYNTTNSCFNSDNYLTRVGAVIYELFSRTNENGDWREMLEVSKLKYLFSCSNSWKREDVHKFMHGAYNYIINDNG